MSHLIRTHLTVSAPLDIVWQTLLRLPDYSTWNPFLTTGSGVIAVGQRVDLTIELPGARAFRLRPWVTSLQPPHYLEWLARLAIPGVLDTRHSFSLTPLTSRRTLLQQSASFAGVLAPYTGRFFRQTRDGFAAMNAALAERASRSAPDGPVDPPELAT